MKSYFVRTRNWYGRKLVGIALGVCTIWYGGAAWSNGKYTLTTTNQKNATKLYRVFKTLQRFSGGITTIEAESERG